MLTHSEFCIFNNDIELYNIAIPILIIMTFPCLLVIFVLINIISYTIGIALHLSIFIVLIFLGYACKSDGYY